ncbi:hypothetical protein ACHAXR_012252 [Thalassiosira sp. AJA248-18]
MDSSGGYDDGTMGDQAQNPADTPQANRNNFAYPATTTNTDGHNHSGAYQYHTQTQNQNQTNYAYQPSMNTGGHSGGYTAHNATALAGGSLNNDHGFQSHPQGFNSHSNFHMGTMAAAGMGREAETSGDPHQSHHTSITAASHGGTAIDGTHGLMLLTQATRPDMSMPTSEQHPSALSHQGNMNVHMRAGADTLASLSAHQMNIMNPAAQPHMSMTATQEHTFAPSQQGNMDNESRYANTLASMNLLAQAMQTSTQEQGIAPNNFQGNMQNEGMDMSVSMRDAGALASLSAPRMNMSDIAMTTTQEHDVAPDQQGDSGNEGMGAGAPICDANVFEETEPSTTENEGTSAPKRDPETISAPPMKKRLIDAGAFGQETVDIQLNEVQARNDLQPGNDETGGDHNEGDTLGGDKNEGETLGRGKNEGGGISSDKSESNVENTKASPEDTTDCNKMSDETQPSQPLPFENEGKIEPSIMKDSPIASKETDDNVMAAGAEPVFENPFGGEEGRNEGTPPPDANNAVAEPQLSEETHLFTNSSDEGKIEPSVREDASAAEPKETDDATAKAADAEPVVEIPIVVEEGTPQPDSAANEKQQIEVVEGDGKTESNVKAAESDTEPMPPMPADAEPALETPFAVEETVASKDGGDEKQQIEVVEGEGKTESNVEAAESDTEPMPPMPADAEPALETPFAMEETVASKDDDDEAMDIDANSTHEGSLGRKEAAEDVADTSFQEEDVAVTVAMVVEKSESKPDEEEASAGKPLATTKEVEDNFPPPTNLPSTGVVSLRGKLTRSDGVHTIAGVWALGLDTILADTENTKGLCLDFEYQHQSSGEVNDFPLAGKYTGWFHLNSDDGENKVKSPEKDIDLSFINNNEGYHNVEGSGSNIYGSYSIIGTLTADGVITMCRKFESPKPKRTKKNSSRKSRSPASGRKRAKHSIGGNRKSHSKKSGTPSKKKVTVIRHRDSGKRYGIGKPGLLCDCCFFEEDEEIAKTPLIQCLYCGLVAHSACYPPVSTVDANGKFLCDVCSAYFHPSVNKEMRTKKTENGNTPPPKPLAEDIEAKSDGRLHGKGVYCQLCARNDVSGGMKPTDSNSWVHLACLMSAEGAYFDEKTAVNVQASLKKNRTELIKCNKESGTEAKCEECGGQSGMLLKCKHRGCELYLHALCAEILDRLRVVENNGERDIISYNCTLHSYGGIDACGVCKLSNKQNEMLECDKCSQGYHMACMTPPLTAIPEGDWFCDKCMKTEPDADGSKASAGDALSTDSTQKESTSTTKGASMDAEEAEVPENDDAPPPGYTAMDF